jgi:hypothetical protein
MNIVEFYVKTFNEQLLYEQLQTAFGTRWTGVGWPGFQDEASGLREPKTETTVVGTLDVGGSVVETTAEPGELHIKVADDFTTTEEGDLTTLLVDHDHTQTTGEQDRRAQDQDDLDTLFAAYQNWDTLTDAQFKGAMKIFLRVTYRRFRAVAI